MKKTILMFAAAGLMLATPSCKKGENDPFLSLSSRKARVAGNWEVTAYSYTSREDDSDGDYYETDAELDGDVITYNSTSYDSDSGTSTTFTSTVTLNEATYAFEKDGTWSSVMDLTEVESYTYTDWMGDQHTETTTTNSVTTTTGHWSFAGKVKDEFKKKERIIINTLTSESSDEETVNDNNDTDGTSTSSSSSSSSSVNYSSGEVVQIYEIDQLKSKEMIWKTDQDFSGSSSFTTGGVTTTSQYDDFTAEEWWTLSIVK
ncbi:MAG: hypothetical protein WDZ35_11990 [Crocinitomicaceae bacterium]